MERRHSACTKFSRETFGHVQRIENVPMAVAYTRYTQERCDNGVSVCARACVHVYARGNVVRNIKLESITDECKTFSRVFVRVCICVSVGFRLYSECV